MRSNFPRRVSGGLKADVSAKPVAGPRMTGDPTILLEYWGSDTLSQYGRRWM
jgi:hypothetical protein